MKKGLFILAVLTLMAVLVVAGTVGCTRSKPGRAPVREVIAPTTVVPEATLPGETATVPPQPTTVGVTAVTPTIVRGIPTFTPTPERVPPTATASPTVGPTAIPGEPTPTPTAVAPPGVTYYTVQRGDTLYSIAVRFNTTVEAIMQANGIFDPRFIYVGQQLTIPGGGPTPPPPSGGRVHIVRPGENLFRIALMYNVTIQDIARANGIVNPRYIYVGQRLVIP